MLRFKSIQSHIILLHVVAVLITAICMPLVLYWFLSSDVERLQRQALEEQGEALARHLVAQPNGGWSFDLPARIRDQYSEAYGRYAYAVLDDKGRVLFSSKGDSKPIYGFDIQSADAAFPEAHRIGRTVSGVSLPVQVGGRLIWIQVAEDLSHRDVLLDDVVANFVQHVGWIPAPMLLMLLAIDLVIFRRAVQPLLRASDQAEHISPSRIDVRLPTENIPREIRPLVIAVNQALERLEEGFRRQGEFAADVAHELRTPLSILRSRIDTLPDQSATEALRADIDRMSRVVNQLLDAAEIETLLIDEGDRADLHAVCTDVAELLAPLALSQRKTIAVTGAEGPVWVRANADILLLAIRNLVENAINHTPPATLVEIFIGDDGVVSIRDQGEGVPIDARDRIFERFWRRDRQRSGGAGLGLSIVKRIVAAHDATIALEDRPGGGAAFTVRLRLAAAPQSASSEDVSTAAGAPAQD
jgi:signal transduction histidine kinase